MPRIFRRIYGQTVHWITDHFVGNSVNRMRAKLEALVDEPAKSLCREAGLFERTPLWFYVLAEAELRQNGESLGEVRVPGSIPSTPNAMISFLIRTSSRVKG